MAISLGFHVSARGYSGGHIDFIKVTLYAELITVI